MFDTRADQPDGVRTVAKTKIGGATISKSRSLTSPAWCLPSGVSAVSLNVAVTNPDAAGFLTVYPCGDRMIVSSVNYTAGQTVSNAVLVPVSATGTVCFYSFAPTDILVDLNGWFATLPTV